MPGFVLWVLAVYGTAFLLSDAKIFESWIPLRPLLRRVGFFRDLLACYFCMGIWISAAAWVWWKWPDPFCKEAWLYILGGSGGVYLVSMVVNFLEASALAHFSTLRSDE